MLKNKIAISFVSILLLSVLCTTSISTAFAKKDVSVGWLSEDTTTKGDWFGHYGSYAYILPDTPVGAIGIEIPLGSYSRPNILADLLNPPYDWEDSQYQGLIQGYYKGSSPYWDEW